MPVLDPRIKEELEQILAVYENDNITAWDMQPDANYVRRVPAEGEELRPSQVIFIRLAEDLDGEEPVRSVKQEEPEEENAAAAN